MTRRRDRAAAPREDRTKEELDQLAGLLREASDLAERLKYPDLAQALWRSRGLVERDAGGIRQREMFAPADVRPRPIAELEDRNARELESLKKFQEAIVRNGIHQ